MADYDSSLPIRTESAGDVDAFISDATTPSQKLKVNADGSIDVNALLQSGAKIILTDGTDDLEINADGSINVQGNDIDIRDLQFATDSVDVSGSSVSITGTVDVSGSSVTVTATDLDIRDISAASDSIAAHLFDEAGAAFSATNPLPVNLVSASEGDEIVDYQTSASVAKNASTDHDFTVSAGKTFLGEEIFVSGSGKLKAEILVNGSTNYVGFNSTANPNIRIPLEKIVKANAAEIIKITITNRDNQPQDVYSTLIGKEV